MARRRPRHMSERLLSNVFAEPNFYRVKDYISAHLKEQYTLKEIRGPIRLNSRLFLQANDTAQKTMQLSRITNEVVGDMCIMSIWINDEVLHFELSYLLITDNADFVALHRICEFMVLCFYTNRDSPPEWLHSRWIFSPYERIGFTVLGDSQYYGRHREELASWLYNNDLRRGALHFARLFNLDRNLRNLSQEAFPVTPPPSEDSTDPSDPREDDDVLYMTELDMALVIDRLSRCADQKEQEQVLEEESQNDMGMRVQRQNEPHGVLIVDGDFWDMLFLNGSSVQGRLESGVLSINDDDTV